MSKKILGISLILIGLAVGLDTAYDSWHSGFTLFRLFLLFFSVYVVIRGIWRLRSSA